MSEQRAFARRLVDLVRVVLSRYVLLGGSQFAAAISYRALFSLVPLATFAATIVAQVLSSSSANRQDFVSAIDDQLKLSPEGAAKLDALITSVPSPWSLAGVATLGLALWGATGVMWSMQKTLAVVFDQGVSRRLIRGRLVSALLVLGALALVPRCDRRARKRRTKVNENVGGLTAAAGFGPSRRWRPRLRLSWPSRCSTATCPSTPTVARRPFTVVRRGRRAHQAVLPGLGWYLSGPQIHPAHGLRVRSSPSSCPST
jgi:hypothetical protein